MHWENPYTFHKKTVTSHGVNLYMKAFLQFRGSRAGLFCDLFAGESCPLRIVPTCRDLRFPPLISREKTAPFHHSLQKSPHIPSNSQTERTCDHLQKTYQLDLGIMSYEPVWHLQRNIVSAKIDRPLPDILIVAEHQPVYTVGRGKLKTNNSFDEDFIRSKGAEIFYVERGGDVTWHGPGQLVCYPIFNLKDRNLGLKEFVSLLEKAIVITLKKFDLNGCQRKKMRGVWVGDNKIASIGLAVKKWISYHGVALNVSPDMSFFKWITPCGLNDIKMVSMQGLLKNTISIFHVKRDLLAVLAETFKLSLSPIKVDEVQKIYAL